MLNFPLKLYEQFLIDPVMSAKVIMGYDLDTFQQVRLRDYWWIPSLVDSSGVSTGKTLIDFIYLNLRCILLPNHVAAVYFPNFSTGRDEFWPYFDKAIAESAIYAQQLRPHHGKLGEHKHQGSYTMTFKNGSRLLMPAPNFMQDSKTQASRRFNTLMVDDYLKAEEMGSGIDKQLVDRTTRESYNQFHPLWQNHFKFLGHADTPSHKGYRRYQAHGRAIRDGSAQHARISFCYKDWTPKFAKRLLPHAVIAQQKLTLTRDEFRRQWLGLWSADGEGVYPESALNRCKRAGVLPETQASPGHYYFLGDDVAIGKSIKADLAAPCVLRATPVATAEEATYSFGESHWRLAFVFVRALRGRTTAQLSGLTYWLHRRFGFSWIVQDPGGGGIAKYDDMQKTTQEHDGETFEVVPVCEASDPMAHGKQPIFSYAKRGGDLDALVNPQFLTAEEGLIDAMHRAFAGAWVSGAIEVPPDLDDLTAREVNALDPTQVALMKELTAMRLEMQNVRAKVGKDGAKLTSARGFTMYESRKKKDRAYAALYAFHAFLIWLHRHYLTETEDEETACCGS